MRRCSVLLAIAAVVVPGATGAIPATKLALMPLPKAAFGPEAVVLSIDPDSGVVDNPTAAEDSADADDTGESLARAGRVAGYRVGFSNPGLLAIRGRLYSVGSDVTLYRSAASAHTGMTARVNEVLSPPACVRAGRSGGGRFAVDGLGDEAAGVTQVVSAGKFRAWRTGIVFRRGELVALVLVARTETRSAVAAATVLARALDARIRGVLAGTVTKPPAALPKPGSRATVDLTPAVLTPADLSGARVTRQEYVKDPDAIAYERELDLGTNRFGKTRFATIENDVSLFPTAVQAEWTVDAAGAVFDPKSPSFSACLEEQMAASGLALTSVKAIRSGIVRSGGITGHQLLARMETGAGKVDVLYVFLHSGRLTGQLYAVAYPGTTFATADAARLVQLLTRRFAAGAKAVAATKPSPPAGRIVFYSELDGPFEIYVMRADGSGVHRLTRIGKPTDVGTENEQGALLPHWSPDGKRIVFQAGPPYVMQGQIYVMNADGSGAQRLTSGGDHVMPDWSPDGRRIAYVSETDGRISVMDATGRNQRPVTPPGKAVAFPTWSPDGKRIAYSCGKTPSATTPTVICAVTVASGRVTTILEGAPGLVALDGPDWSPDGSKLAFHAQGPGGNIDVYVVGVDGKGLRRLTTDPAYDLSPTWSPDGRRIVFASKRGGRTELYVMNADGSRQAPLTDNPAHDNGPDWGR